MPRVLRAVRAGEGRGVAGLHRATPDHAAEAQGVEGGCATALSGVAHAQQSWSASVDPPSDQGPLRWRTQREECGQGDDKDVRWRQQAEHEGFSAERKRHQHGRALRGRLWLRDGRGLLPPL